MANSAEINRGQKEPEKKTSPLTQFIFITEQKCNLACRYCVVYESPDKTYRRKPSVMSDEVFTKAATRIGEYARKYAISEVEIVFFGGEATMRWAQDETYFRRATTTVRNNLPEGTTPNFALQTNGVLLGTRPELLDELRSNNILVGVSLDGDRAANRKRINHAGKESYEDVARGLRSLQYHYRDIYAGILNVIDPSTDPIAVYEALTSFNPPSIDFNLPNRNWSDSFNEQATPYAQWLLQIYKRWRRDILKGKTVPRIRTFDAILKGIYGQNVELESLGINKAKIVTIETDGSYENNQAFKSAYEGASGFDGMNIFTHSLEELVQHPAMRAKDFPFDSLSDACKGCEIVDICGGGLQAHRFSPMDDPSRELKQGFENRSAYCTDLGQTIGGILHEEFSADAEKEEAISIIQKAVILSTYPESPIFLGAAIAKECQRTGQDPQRLREILLMARIDKDLEDKLFRVTHKPLGVEAPEGSENTLARIKHSSNWASMMIDFTKEDFAATVGKYSFIRGLSEDTRKTALWHLGEEILRLYDHKRRKLTDPDGEIIIIEPVRDRPVTALLDLRPMSRRVI